MPHGVAATSRQEPRLSWPSVRGPVIGLSPVLSATWSRRRAVPGAPALVAARAAPCLVFVAARRRRLEPPRASALMAKRARSRDRSLLPPEPAFRTSTLTCLPMRDKTIWLCRRTASPATSCPSSMLSVSCRQLRRALQGSAGHRATVYDTQHGVHSARLQA